MYSTVYLPPVHDCGPVEDVEYEEEEGEEEEPESDAEMVPAALQQEIDSVLQPPAPVRWFTGRVHKLDD